MEYTYQDVLAELAAMRYFLPPQQELTDTLRERKFTPMPVSMQRFADFVTGSLDSFLHFVRVNNVRAVMFSYAYYSEKELEEHFKLEDADKSFFVNHTRDVSKQNQYLHSGPKTSDMTDYTDYLRYSKYILRKIDLSHPKELRLYAVVQGKVIACQLGDAWLQRLNLIGRMSLRRYTMEHNLGAGSLPFHFISDPRIN